MTTTSPNASSFLVTALTGHDLIDTPLLNKGTAFSQQERRELGLLGLLAPHVDTIDEQVDRAYEAFCAEPNAPEF